MNHAAKALADHIDRDSAAFAKAMCFGEIAANVMCGWCKWVMRKDSGPSHFLFCENVRCPQFEVLYQGLTTPLTPAVPSKAALFFTSKGALANPTPKVDPIPKVSIDWLQLQGKKHRKGWM